MPCKKEGREILNLSRPVINTHCVVYQTFFISFRLIRRVYRQRFLLTFENTILVKISLTNNSTELIHYFFRVRFMNNNYWNRLKYATRYRSNVIRMAVL